MPFWTYMLHCADRSFYVGHTDNLEQRLWQHQHGIFAGYTSTRRPVALVWSDVFERSEEAREMESRLQGWSRLKKLALIRGDWDGIAQLASAKKKGASTSSSSRAWSGESFLYPHLNTSSSQPFSLEAKVRVVERFFHVFFRLSGPIGMIRLPSHAASQRRDGLWERSCFKMFVATAGTIYYELNLSPSTDWAAYGFAGYRNGMSKLSIEPPVIRVDRTARTLELSAKLVLPEGVTPTRIGLSAVLEEKSGRKSYWALAHPPGPPDFHHPDCFALELPPPRQP